MHGIYFILTVKDPIKALDLLKMVVDTGLAAIQLRAKEGIHFQCAYQMHLLCQKHNVPLIVNDDVDLAIKLQAEGVHLGQTDMPISKARQLLGQEKIIGATAPLPAQIQIAALEGASYVGVGHVFPTTTKKKKGPPIGYKGIQEAAQASTIPIVAIGGLTIETLYEVYRSGASCAAVCAAIASAPNPQKSAKQLVNQWKSIYNRSN